MFNTLAKPTNGIIYFNDGSEMTLENILSAEVEMGMSYGCHEDTTIKLNLGKNLHGEIFTLNIPSVRKEEKEVKTNFYLITVRFMSRPGCYKFNTKLYDYYITAELKNSLVNRLGIGSEIKILGKSGEELYSGSKLRVENIMGFETLEDAKIVSGVEELKEIKNLVVLGEYRLDLSSNFPKYSIYENKIYYNNIEAEKYWNMCSYFLPPANENKTNNQPFNGQELYVSTADTKPFYYVENTNSEKIITKMEEKDMSKNMFGNMFKNMKFGRLNTDEIKYSFNGIAFKTSDGDYVTYNDDFTFTNVADMIIDMPIFAMPVSREQISVGDVIRHNDTWVIVNEVSSTEIKVAKPWTKEIVTVIPETSIFGFSFYTKIMNPFEGLGKEANADNPFGNILPFLMMQGSESGDSTNTLMMAMMFGGGKIDMSNPMMMYMMMSQNKEIDPMMMMLMMGNNPFAPKQEKITEDKIDSMIDSGLIKKLYEKISTSLNEVSPVEEKKGE